jgi:predicted DNA-binding protein (UPF0251 family)
MTAAWQDVRRSDLYRLRVEEGLYWREIGERFGVSEFIVLRQGAVWKIPRPEDPRLLDWHRLSDADLRRLYLIDGLTQTQIGARYGVSHTTVSDRLRTLGLAQGQRSSRGRLAWATATKEEIAALYWDGRLSSNQIGRRYRVHGKVVLKRMAAWGIPRRSRGATPPAAWYTVSDREIARLYHEEDLSGAEIGRRLHVSGTTVRRRLRAAGIPIKSPYYTRTPHPWSDDHAHDHDARRAAHLAAYHAWLAAQGATP